MTSCISYWLSPTTDINKLLSFIVSDIDNYVFSCILKFTLEMFPEGSLRWTKIWIIQKNPQQNKTKTKPKTVLSWGTCSCQIGLKRVCNETVLIYTTVNLKHSIQLEELLSFLFLLGVFWWGMGGGGCFVWFFCLFIALLPHWKGRKQVEKSFRSDKTFS